MSKVAAFLAVVSVFALGSAEAWAQGKGKGGKMRGRGDPRRATWFPSLEAVKEDRAADKKKYILVYIKPPTEQNDPSEFFIMDIVQASHEAWAFVKMDFDKNNAFQKELGIKTFPVCVGLDIHGNDFLRTTGLTIESVRMLLKEVPEKVEELKGKIEDDFERAEKLAQSGNESQAAKLFADLARIPKKGYPKIDAAGAKAAAAAERPLTEIEQEVAGDLRAKPSYLTGATYDLQPLDEKPAIVRLRTLAEDYRDLPCGVRAEVLLAELESKKSVVPAIVRLKKLLKYSGPSFAAEVERARKLLESIVADGLVRIAAATTTETLRAIAKDYAGTEAEKKAIEKLRSLGG